MIPYFNYRLTYIPDRVLGFRERPYRREQIQNFRGFGYSPLYGIEIQPETLLWQTDEDGFRNRSETNFADIVVIGSSFPEYGADLEDTYPSRLEKKLGGSKVLNFAKAGYGPLEYMKVFQRYGLKKKPKYAIFALNAAGDIDEHLADWINDRTDSGLAKRNIAFGGFFVRYRIALEQTWGMLTSSCWTAVQLGFNRLLSNDFVHPDVAVLRLPNGASEKMVFLDKHSARSPDELLRSREWRLLETILVKFQNLSKQHDIVPLLLYIPGATETYSRYSTRDSGANWLRLRDRLIATSGNNEEAIRRLSAKVGMKLIDLRPAFEQAAQQGKLLYYPLDAHWNSEGREIAAEVTANFLRATYPGEQKRNPSRKEKRSGSATQLVNGVNEQDVVMTRTLNGTINSWNRNAERLYGWKKEEVIGKVSHKLLRTQFPEPLEKIDAELLQTGHWNGKLVHATQDGRRVVVESRWVLDPKGHGRTVVEINTRSGDSLISTPAG